MAHQIEFNQEKNSHSFFSKKEVAWHGLGKIVQGALTAKEALEACNANFEVKKSPLVSYIDGEFLSVPDKFNIQRADNLAVLGIVGNDYKPVQNIDSFSFIDHLIESEGAIYETGAVLGRGERVFVSAKLPSFIKLDDNDIVDNYIIVTNSHDGTGSLTCGFTPIRVVCNNTLGAALRTMKRYIKIRHTTNLNNKIEEARRVLKISNDYTKTMGEIFDKMSSIKATEEDYLNAYVNIFATKKDDIEKYYNGEASTRYVNLVNECMKYAFENPTQKMATTQGTVFGIYNGLTGYYQNEYKFRNQENKFQNIHTEHGTANKKQAKLFNSLVLDYKL